MLAIARMLFATALKKCHFIRSNGPSLPPPIDGAAKWA